MIDDKKLNISSEVDGVLEEEDAANYYMAREITQEILNFGVNQTTLLKVIELLALEVENRQHMLAIINSVKQKPELTNSSSIIT